MSLLRRESDTPDLYPFTRPIPGGFTLGAAVSTKRAMSHSVVWGATRLRADVVSLMPVDTYRDDRGVSIEVAKPSVLVTPSQIADGHPMTIGEWMSTSQTSLDRTGNSVGIIKAVDGLKKPSRIDLVDPDLVEFRCKGSQIVEYVIAGETVKPEYIWHERQYTVAGIPFGLSPIASAALQLTAGLSAQQWAVNWFTNGAAPSGHLKNEKKVLAKGEAELIRAQYSATQHAGVPFVSGIDWTYTPMAAKAAESQFLEQMHYTDTDLCRFLGVPADMLDVVTGASGSLTYANITQRNLQLLVMNLGGAIKRREDALSTLLASPRFVKLNRSAVLAMDALTRAQVQAQRITNRTMTPDEARALEDAEPLTEEQYAQFDRLWPVTRVVPTTQGGQ
jgi:HK97 family phage portal protein